MLPAPDRRVRGQRARTVVPSAQSFLAVEGDEDAEILGRVFPFPRRSPRSLRFYPERSSQRHHALIVFRIPGQTTPTLAA